MGNLIVGPDGIRGRARLGSSHRGRPDRGPRLVLRAAWRFGSPAVAGERGSVQQLIDAYIAAGGAPVTVDEVRWWEALGTLRWADLHPAGVGAPGCQPFRRAGCHRSAHRREREEDLLEIVAGPSDRVPAPAARPSVEVGRHRMTVRPTAELLEAVEEYLTEVRTASRDGWDSTPGSPRTWWPRSAARSSWDPTRPVSADERLASLGISVTGRAGEAELAAPSVGDSTTAPTR